MEASRAPPANDYRARLIALAGELKTGLVDMTDAWARYVRSTGEDVTWFKRDEVHTNERGEQVIGRILAAHLAPPLPGK
jgi:lysophospholipase L1-like esterase